MRNDNALSEAECKTIAKGLARVLADTHGLYIKTHGFHWNVEGQRFRTLHLMFEEQYTDLWNALDDIAERVRALGHYAPSSYADFAELTEVEEERGVPGPWEMVRKLVHDNEIVVRTMREIRPAVDDAGDDATAALLDDRLVQHEKQIWMMRSMLKDVDDKDVVSSSILNDLT
ncbi:Dps family protein [Amorphus coralli]|uniref:Dps family protein n=1 Tax=Amorphus coralli TaxID=340680 RepID=UPI000361FC3F|nr:DNA starvation/stationary phase protection protein [Amorphus coralli]